MRLLVLRPGALGDLLLGLPALRALCRRLPDAVVHVAGNRAFVPLLAWCPDVAGTHDFGSARFTGLFVDEGETPEDLGSLLRTFDVAVLWMRDPGGTVARRLRVGGIERVVGGDPAPAGLHVARRLTTLLTDLDPDAPDLAEPTLRVSLQPSFAALHPGSGGHGKLWDLDGFAVVARRLLARGWPVRVLSGPADGDRGDRLLALLSGQVQHVRPVDSQALAGELARAAVFIGNDSGPAHLAGALGVATVAIFGPTDPALWRPCGPRVATLGGNGSWPDATQVVRSTLSLLED